MRKEGNAGELMERGCVGGKGRVGGRESRWREVTVQGERRKETVRGEGLCLISGPGESLGSAKEEHGMFSNWPCSVQRGGKEEKQGRDETDTKRIETQGGQNLPVLIIYSFLFCFSAAMCSSSRAARIIFLVFCSFIHQSQVLQDALEL